jgi:hypothetical protein
MAYYIVKLRLKYAPTSLEFKVPCKTVGNLTSPDFYRDKDVITIEGKTYLRRNIMTFYSKLID